MLLLSDAIFSWLKEWLIEEDYVLHLLHHGTTSKASTVKSANYGLMPGAVE